MGVEEAVDVLWSANGPELYLLLASRRWRDPDRFRRWLTDAWTLLLLDR